MTDRHRRRRPARPHAGVGGLSARAATSCSSIRAPDAPGGQVAPHPHGAFDDRATARASSRSEVEVLTFDWENISVDALRAAAAPKPVSCPPIARSPPRRIALHEKHAVRAARRSRRTRWRAVDSRARPARRAIAKIGLPGVLKTRRLGYDGKGQCLVREPRTMRSAPGKQLGVGAAALRGVGAVRLRGVDHRRAQHARRDRASIRSTATCTATASCADAVAPFGHAALQSSRETYLKRLLRALRLHRRADHRVLRRRRAADRQRDGAARPQLRPLDDRGRRDQPVREPPARDPRPAARLDAGAAATAP